MAIHRTAFTLARLAAAAIAGLSFHSALAQSIAKPSPQPVRIAPAPMAVLNCLIHPPPFGSGEVTVTNVGTAQVPAGGVILVIPIQAGSASSTYALASALPPGGAVSLPMSGVSLLARGCAATLR